jgi:hypothetical protein
MKVMKDNYKKFSVEVTCADCGSIIEIENIEELEWLGDDIYCWYCPCCGNYNEVEF